MQDDFRTYLSQFDRVVQFQEQRNAQVAELDRVGPELERNLTRVMESAFRDQDAESA
ncbi:MAG: hypothetical protein U5L06_01375 [Rhodovibrio sp.]|nr:hypothetical protein [Rhodovibrio sp.]